MHNRVEDGLFFRVSPETCAGLCRHIMNAAWRSISKALKQESSAFSYQSLTERLLLPESSVGKIEWFSQSGTGARPTVPHDLAPCRRISSLPQKGAHHPGVKGAANEERNVLSDMYHLLLNLQIASMVVQRGPKTVSYILHSKNRYDFPLHNRARQSVVHGTDRCDEEPLTCLHGVKPPSSSSQNLPWPSSADKPSTRLSLFQTLDPQLPSPSSQLSVA